MPSIDLYKFCYFNVIQYCMWAAKVELLWNRNYLGWYNIFQAKLLWTLKFLSPEFVLVWVEYEF